jgi:hypothetical protein
VTESVDVNVPEAVPANAGAAEANAATAAIPAIMFLFIIFLLIPPLGLQ